MCILFELTVLSCVPFLITMYNISTFLVTLYNYRFLILQSSCFPFLAFDLLRMYLYYRRCYGNYVSLSISEHLHLHLHFVDNQPVCTTCLIYYIQFLIPHIFFSFFVCVSTLRYFGFFTNFNYLVAYPNLNIISCTIRTRF